MIYLGLDPGTSDNMALAVLFPGDIRVALADCGDARDARARAVNAQAAVYQSFVQCSACLGAGQLGVLALEWQRPLPTDKRPVNICDLSAFAGIALATIQSLFGSGLTVYTPLPEEWKGQVPKHIKHNRIVSAAGLALVVHALDRADIPVPKDLGAFKKEFTGKAGNALDAIGLTLWARERQQLQARVRSARLGPS